tara:strand:- start:17 stop:622 length:606 start_codon:yes stop_codon:yes gene_type:complete
MHQIFDYENSSELNPQLHEALFSNLPVRVGVAHTYSPDKKHKQSDGEGHFLISPRDLHQRDIHEVNILLRWIGSLVPLAAHRFSNPNPSKYDYEDYLPLSDNGGGKYNFNIDAFKLVHCWCVFYSKGDCVEPHNHFPYSLSFCYYIDTPEGSSPLIVDDEEINVKQGQVVFFPSNSFHSVPPCSVDGRCAIAGNIMYIDNV